MHLAYKITFVIWQWTWSGVDYCTRENQGQPPVLCLAQTAGNQETLQAKCKTALRSDLGAAPKLMIKRSGPETLVILRQKWVGSAFPCLPTHFQRRTV